MERLDLDSTLRSALDRVAERLVSSYPAAAPGAVMDLLLQAIGTVERMTGKQDLHLAEDLTALRLDIRGRGTSGAG